MFSFRVLRIWLLVAIFLGLSYLSLDRIRDLRPELPQAPSFGEKTSTISPLPPPPPPPPPAPNLLESSPTKSVSLAYPSDASVHEITLSTTTIVSYPSDYLPVPSDDEECEALYSSRYLEHIASHHIPYCEDGSRSELECFRTHRNETLCLATGVLIDQTREEAKNKTTMHCQLRNFTGEALENPTAAKFQYGVLNVEDMPVGFFDTGPPSQLKYWDVSTKDANMAMGADKLCEPGKSNEKWTLLVKRENHGNVWHKLMELWQSMVTLDALQMAIDPSTNKPYLLPTDVPNIQVVFTDGDAGIVDGVGKWWDMLTGNTPLLQKDMAPTCLGKVILPLAGSTSPFWAHHWEEKDCHNKFLLDAFLRRVYRHIGIAPEKHGNQTSETVVTIIDRKGRRKLRDLEGLVANMRARWPDITFQLVDFAIMSLEEQVALTRKTDVLVGLTGAGLTHTLWLPEESSLAEIQAPNKRMPEAQPYTGFRNLAKMRNLHYLMAHSERREGASDWDWQSGEWVDVKPEVFEALIDAAINAQLHKGSSKGEVLPR